MMSSRPSKRDMCLYVGQSEYRLMLCAHQSGGGDLSIMQSEGECSRRSQRRRGAESWVCASARARVLRGRGGGGVKLRR